MERAIRNGVHLHLLRQARKVGGRYYSHFAGEAYEVIDIETENPPPGWVWRITVRWLTGPRAEATASHCTSWNPKKDRALS